MNPVAEGCAATATGHPTRGASLRVMSSNRQIRHDPAMVSRRAGIALVLQP